MSTSSPRRLDRAAIVATAMQVADESGLDATSMRGVADRLGVTAMALYKHVAHRSELVDEMLDRAVESIAPAPVEAGDWRAQVRGRIMAARALMGAHPWVRDAIESRPVATPRTLRHMDALMADMFAGGLSADLVHHAMHALSTRMWGFTRDILPIPSLPDDPADRAAAVAAFSSSYPAIVQMATTAPHAADGCDDDAEFAFALDLVLDGIERLRASGWRSA